MRQPMEERKISIARARLTVEYPASFMLVAAMNPCPCGYYNHPDIPCTCPPGSVQRYLNKVSGPLMDRIDIHVEVVPVDFSDLTDKKETEKSINIRPRVIEARNIQKKRFIENKDIHANAQMTTKLLRIYCQIDDDSQTLLKTAMEKLNLSARAYDRILKVARTIADLVGSENIQSEHLAEAIHFRSLDRESWGA
jgi:magnesium chelatase family protein